MIIALIAIIVVLYILLSIMTDGLIEALSGGFAPRWMNWGALLCPVPFAIWLIVTALVNLYRDRKARKSGGR